jgi:asparagine synthase (glutamine-hydrolysing)
LQHVFECNDPGVTRQPVEVRHILMDVRLVRFLLALPPVPWCIKKWMIRAALRGVLPAAIWRRPKSPMAGDPVALQYRRAGSRLISLFKPTGQLREYVNVSEWQRVATDATMSDEYWRHLYPLCLNHWFHFFHEVPHGSNTNNQHDHTAPGRDAPQALPDTPTTHVR